MTTSYLTYLTFYYIPSSHPYLVYSFTIKSSTYILYFFISCYILPVGSFPVSFSADTAASGGIRIATCHPFLFFCIFLTVLFFVFFCASHHPLFDMCDISFAVGSDRLVQCRISSGFRRKLYTVARHSGNSQILDYPILDQPNKERPSPE